VPPLLWTQKQDVGPQPRVGASAAFDSGRGRVVLFGGAAPPAAAFADTWEWDGESWTQVADTGPDARTGHALAFDRKRGRVVLFGGIAADTTLRRDTWEWDGESWTQVADTGPDARTGHRLAFDSGRSVGVLFGGIASGSVLRGDTWGWDGTRWTQAQDAGPSARQGHALTFDIAHAQVMLYGGSTGAAVVGDTWTYNGSEWTERSDFGPPACVGASMVSIGSSVLLYGGVASLVDAAARMFAGTWQWDGQRWTQRQDIGPGPRWGHAMAFDSTRGCAVVYGGASTPPAVAPQLLGDTWEEQGTPLVGVPGLSITQFTVNPPNGRSAVLTVSLNKPAPQGGVNVPITVEFGWAQVTPMFIPAGATTGQAQLVVQQGIPPGPPIQVTATLGEQVMLVTFMIA
jgi:Galactose oxidase, central domain